MSLHVIEGTWEEIKSREAELIGQYLRVTIKPIRPLEAIAPKQGVPANESTTIAPKEKVLRARGMLAGVLSTEEYFREKSEDKIREDRSL